MPEPKRFTLVGVCLVLVCLAATGSAFANDGFSGLVNGGLEFSRTSSVEMHSEVLTISPRKVSAAYAFRNVSDKDVRGIVAFPISIKCGWFDTPSDYPESFQTSVNGRPVATTLERRAFMRTGPDVDHAYGRLAKGKPGSDITGELLKARLPVDCRKAPPDSPNYKALVSHGWALDPALDPWMVFYETRLRYYWTQVFPARGRTTIEHTYVPSRGGGNGGPVGSAEIQQRVDRYKRFFEGTPSLAHLVKSFKPGNGYVSVDYVLTTANTWASPIRTFELVIPKPQHFVVTTLDGDLSYRDGNLVISIRNFSPSSELTVVFFGDMPGYQNVRL